ncbi:MAG: hypothetical protein H6631_18515 [Anaerolineaceae bacterium]|nr:hypothetical protein [Anaerolineaceae bacterium]
MTTPGGTVAVYIWDYAGTMAFLTYFWDVAVELNQRCPLHENTASPSQC